MIDNPYTSPARVIDGDEPLSQSVQHIARRTYHAWEKLRILHIGILATIALLLLASSDRWNGRLWRMIIEGAVVANLGYFAGPAVGTYVRWLGYNRAWPRWVMFGCGTAISALLAIGLLATQLLPDQD